MMKFWTKIKQWLFSGSKTDRDIEFDYSYAGKLELERIIEKIKRVINKTSQQDGQPHGFIIKQEIDKYHNVLNKHSSNQLNSCDHEITKCKITQTVQTKFAQAYFDESDEIIESNKSEIDIFHSRYITQKQELDKFKTKNRLTRDADYPSSTSKSLKILIMISLILIEGILNSYFFAQGLDSGLLGGFIVAGAFAFVNVMVAFMCGCYLVRYIFHVNFLKKSVGLIFCMISLCFMSLWGLVIAHYRDALSPEFIQQEPTKRALHTLINSPFELQDIMSWCLFCISILFAIISLIDGLFLDDRYPGYGKIFRHYEQVRDEYYDVMNDIHNDLIDKKEEHIKKVHDSYLDCQKKLTNYSDMIQIKSDFENRYQSDYSAIELAFKALLEWDNIPKIEWSKYQDNDHPVLNWHIEKDKTEYQHQLAEFELFKNNRDQIISDIQSSFQKKYSVLNSVYGVTQLDEGK